MDAAGGYMGWADQILLKMMINYTQFDRVL